MSQWIPTHVQFTVLRARNLIAKGKGGNNDVFVTIQLGKEKYQTSTIKNALNPEWFEECDLPVTNMGLEIEVSVYHRGVLSDNFLGYVAIPLWEYKITETVASRWVSLRNKPSKPGPDKYRGELEVKLTFRSQHRHDSMSQAIKKRSPSIRNLTTTIGDKIKFARSRSFRDNRKESDFGKMDKCQSFVATEPRAFNESQPDSLTRSYSMSTAYIKTMSLDRNKRLNYSVRSNLTSKHSSQNVAAETPSPGMADCYSQSLYSLPLKRRGVDVSFNQLPPPPYNLKVSPKDGSSTTLTENTPNTPNSHSTSTLSNSLSPGPSQLEPTRLEFSGIYESIKEKTEPENTASSSSDPESVPMPKIRGKRFPKKQPFPVRSRNQDSLKDNATPSHASGRENSDQQQFYGNGRDSGILDDRSSSLGNSLEGSLAAIDGTNTGSKIRGPSGNVDAHIDHGKSDAPLGRTPADRGLLYHLDREMSMSGSIRQRKAVSPPSMFYSKENQQGELVVRKRSRGQRDRDRNRLLQIKPAGSPGLYDDSVSDASDVSPVPDDLLSVFKNMTKEELLRVVITSKAQMIRKDQYIRDLENYIDDLLVRVMETTPRLLTRPQPVHRF